MYYCLYTSLEKKELILSRILDECSLLANSGPNGLQLLEYYKMRPGRRLSIILVLVNVLTTLELDSNQHSLIIINCLPVTPFTTYQGNSYTTVRWKCCLALNPHTSYEGKAAVEQMQLRRHLLAPSKNISELDCFITHGRTLTCQLTQLYFICPPPYLLPSYGVWG
jgi:hypothetical protein